MATLRKRYKGIKQQKNTESIKEGFNCSRRSKHPVDILIKLPDDMLKLISSRLSFADRTRASAVCKNWFLLFHEMPPLPWIMTYQWTIKENNNNNNTNKNHDLYGQHDGDGDRGAISVFLEYELFDPCNIEQKSYLVKQKITTSFSNGIGTDKYNFLGSHVCASKDGWVMFYSPKYVFKDQYKSIRFYFFLFFLFNPFTKEIIKLPDLVSNSYDLATFSSSPSSGSCVFFVLEYNYNYHGLIIRTCRRGDKTWKMHIIHGHHPKFQEAVYADGSFYCVSPSGQLAAFNVARQEWTVLIKFEPFIKSYCRKPHLVELNGELLLVNLSTYEPTSYCSLYTFDKNRKAWVCKQGLEDRALFIGECSSYLISTTGEEALKNTANKVYYNPIIPYSTKFCYLRDSNNTNCRNCKGSEFYSWVYRENGRDGIWIQPPNSSMIHQVQSE